MSFVLQANSTPFLEMDSLNHLFQASISGAARLRYAIFRLFSRRFAAIWLATASLPWSFIRLTCRHLFFRRLPTEA